MEKFSLLKRTYPVSQFDRPCDGFTFIMDNTTEDQRKALGFEIIKNTIIKGETYIYQVGKEGDKLKTSCISLENFEIIRINFFGKNDDD